MKQEKKRGTIRDQVKCVIKMAAVIGAESTSTGFLYQPEMPECLRKQK